MSNFYYDLNTKYVAPYWADADNFGNGEVFYRQTTDPTLLQRATAEIRAAFPIQNDVTMKSLLIVTWYRTIPYNIYDTNNVVSTTAATYYNNKDIIIIHIHKCICINCYGFA